MASDDSMGGGAAQHRHKDWTSLMQAMRPRARQEAATHAGAHACSGQAWPEHYVELDFDELDLARYEVALNAALYRQRDQVASRLTSVPLLPLELAVQDLRALSGAALELALQETRTTMSNLVATRERWPASRFCASLHGDNKVRLHVSHVHSGCAGMLGDAMHYYQYPDQPLPRLRSRGADGALDQAVASPQGQQAMSYWLARLPGLPRPPALPRSADNTRSHSQPQRRAMILLETSWSAFSARAARFGVAPASAVFAVHAEVMAQWSGNRHFLLNHLLAPTEQGQDHAGLDLYPLEIDMRTPGPFIQHARALQQRMALDARHAAYGGARVLRALSQLHDMPGRAPSPFVIAATLDMETVAGHANDAFAQILFKYQFCQAANGSAQFMWDVIEREFPDGMIDAMWQAQRSLLNRLADDDQAWLEETGSLLPAIQRDQRTLLNATALPRPQGMLQQNLAWQAEVFGPRPAVICAGLSLSYGELHSRSNQLAHQLRAAGARPNALVAVLLDKGWQQMVALHGIQLAGAAYVPIDAAWPEARIRQTLEHSEARILVTRAGLRPPRLALAQALEVVCVDAEQAGEADWPDDGLDPAQTPEDLAYVLYQEQDGVMIDHRGALNTVLDINRRFGIGARDVLFGLAPLGSDLSVYDVFGTIAAGATLVLPAAEDTAAPAAWLAAMQEHGVTVWNGTPAQMQLLVDAARTAPAVLPALATVLLSGGRIPLKLLRHIRQLAPHARVISLGGASEASVWSICHPVERLDEAWASIPYGKPLANQRWHILDQHGNDTPQWTSGSLYIGGIGLATGYWRDGEKTAARFVRHPRTGERLFRTGNLGRYLPDGNIEFLGRADGF